MRKDRICPKCQSKRFIVVPEARFADPVTVRTTAPLALAAEWLVVKKGSGGMFGGARTERVEARVEAWICDGCGFSELYANDLEVLRKMLGLNAESVRLVDNTPPGSGAFR